MSGIFELSDRCKELLSKLGLHMGRVCVTAVPGCPSAALRACSPRLMSQKLFSARAHWIGSLKVPSCLFMSVVWRTHTKNGTSCFLLLLCFPVKYKTWPEWKNTLQVEVTITNCLSVFVNIFKVYPLLCHLVSFGLSLALLPFLSQQKNFFVIFFVCFTV